MCFCVAVQADLGSLRMVPHVEGSHIHHLRWVHPKRSHTKVQLTGETFQSRCISTVHSCIILNLVQLKLLMETQTNPKNSQISIKFLHPHEVVFRGIDTSGDQKVHRISVETLIQGHVSLLQIKIGGRKPFIIYFFNFIMILHDLQFLRFLLFSKHKFFL